MYFQSIDFTCLSTIMLHQIFSLASDWSKRVTWLNIPHRAKSGEYPSDMCCEKHLNHFTQNGLHFARKHARIFVRGHYLFLKAQRFPQSTLSENCSLPGTENVRWQLSQHFFAANRGYCLFSLCPTKSRYVIFIIVLVFLVLKKKKLKFSIIRDCF